MTARVLLTDGEQRSVVAAVRGLAQAGYEVGVAASRPGVAAHWSRSCDARYHLPDPWDDPAVFALALSHLVRDGTFDVLLPGTDASLLAISAYRDYLEPHVRLGLPAHEKVVRSLDKLVLSEQAESAGIPCPPSTACVERDEVMAAARAFGFPVVLKPVTSLVRTDRVAWRQPGVVIEDESHLNARLHDFGLPLIVQRREAAGSVVSVAGVMSGDTLVARACARYARTWPATSGSASLSVSIEPPEELVHRVAQLITGIGWQGIFELELLELADGSLRSIDLNPRVYGSLALAIDGGANLPALWCDLLLGRDVAGSEALAGRRYRWEEGEIRNALQHLRRRELSNAVEVLCPHPDVTHAYFRLSDPGPFAAWLSGLPARAVANSFGAGRHVHDVSASARPIGPGTFGRRLPGGTAEVVTDCEQLAELVPAWERLAEQLGNVFVSPAWYFTWLQHYGAVARPFATVLRHDDGSLHSLLPFVLSRGRRHATVTFAGANLGDYFQPVAPPGDTEVAAAGAALALSRRRREWSAVVLHNVAVDARWVTALRRGGRDGLVEVTHPPEALPYLTFDGMSWDDYLATRSRNLRGQVSRKLRRLADEHAVSFRLAADPARLEQDMAAFFAFHDSRWDERGGSSMQSTRARAFHVDFARAALAAGRLRLWFLDVDDAPVAAWYGWSYGNRYAYYLAGFDPAWSRFSVGLLLLAHTIRAAAEEGALEYDMLRGDEGYKDRFATGRRYAVTRIATAPLHPLRLAALAELALRDAGRRLPQGLRDRVRDASSSVLDNLPGARER